MKYFQILRGRSRGLYGRIIGSLGVFLILLVQARDQWFLEYLRPDCVKPVKSWTLKVTNGTNYVEKF